MPVVRFARGDHRRGGAGRAVVHHGGLQRSRAVRAGELRAAVQRHRGHVAGAVGGERRHGHAGRQLRGAGQQPGGGRAALLEHHQHLTGGGEREPGGAAWAALLADERARHAGDEPARVSVLPRQVEGGGAVAVPGQRSGAGRGGLELGGDRQLLHARDVGERQRRVAAAGRAVGDGYVGSEDLTSLRGGHFRGCCCPPGCPRWLAAGVEVQPAAASAAVKASAAPAQASRRVRHFLSATNREDTGSSPATVASRLPQYADKPFLA